MAINLYDYQWEAIRKLKNGSILCGGVGSGKSRTALAYYFVEECGGVIDGLSQGLEYDYIVMKRPRDLYIITTARKRDTFEWEGELVPFLLSENGVSVTIDSWNNIKKYTDVKDAFFIFDEQRVVGYGAWTHAFLKIAEKNDWILLSATPGDTWMDYIPVFIANGFYRNKTDFVRRHVVYSRYSKFPQVSRYLEQGRLIRYRDMILVNMNYHRPTTAHHETVIVNYDKDVYRDMMARRWNIYENMPIASASELCYTGRKIINSDPSRGEAILKLCSEHPKVIIFYNYNYELDILRSLDYEEGTDIAEWNGQKHQHVPVGSRWVYLVNYKAGAEGWNCIETDTIIFYSLSYSYKEMVQAAGRIDRMNTPFLDLYYYRLRSACPLDLAVSRALKKKQNFNESKFASS